MQYAEFRRVSRHSEGAISWDETREGVYIPDMRVAVYETFRPQKMSTYGFSRDDALIDELHLMLNGSKPEGGINYETFETRDGDEASLQELVTYAEEIDRFADETLIARLRAQRS